MKKKYTTAKLQCLFFEIVYTHFIKFKNYLLRNYFFFFTTEINILLKKLTFGLSRETVYVL